MSERTPEPRLGDFRFVHEVEVRFRDLDSMGHAHHTLPLIYIEEARAAYWRAVKGNGEIDYVLGEVGVRFRRRIEYPQRLRIGVRTHGIGRSSFTMEYGIFDEAGELLASCRTVQVMYDYAAGTSMRLADSIREAIERVEGRPAVGTYRRDAEIR